MEFPIVTFDVGVNLRVRAKITSQNWRSDLVQVWSIQESKTTGIASYFEDFENEASAKDELKQRCKNVKLFLREPLVIHPASDSCITKAMAPADHALESGPQCQSAVLC